MQTWTENCYDASHIVNTDMSNIEINFATLKSAFSGIAAPAAIVAGQIYFNTSKNIHHFLNAAESDLLALLPGDLSTKIWQYRNDATPGWVIDASVTDKVIAIKGGSDDYDINGGSAGGDFDHTHTGPSHKHTGSIHRHTIPALKLEPVSGNNYIDIFLGLDVQKQTTPSNSGYSSGANDTGAAGTGATGGSSTFRPAAAVGTLQYPNVTQS